MSAGIAGVTGPGGKVSSRAVLALGLQVTPDGLHTQYRLNQSN